MLGDQLAAGPASPYRCGGNRITAEPQPDVPTFPLTVSPNVLPFHLLLSIKNLNTVFALSLFQLSTGHLLLLVLPASPSCPLSAVPPIRCLVGVGTFYKQDQTDRTTRKRKNKNVAVGSACCVQPRYQVPSHSEEGGGITKAALCQRSGNDEEV